MDNDSKLLTEQYKKITEELKDTVHSAMYQEIVDCYYEIIHLSRSPKTDPAYVKTIQDGLRDILKSLRKQLPHLEGVDTDYENQNPAS